MTHSSGDAHRHWWPVPAGSTATSPASRLEHLARRAAEAHLGAAARYSECLVDLGVIVHVGKNAVAPHVAPAVCGKRALDDALGAICAGDIDRAAIEQKRKMRIVGYGAVVAKHQREWFIRPGRFGHGASSQRRSRDMNAQT